MIEYRRFLKACIQVEHTQAIKLKNYIKNNQNTLFGKTHDFRNIDNYQRFANKVPLQEWHEIQGWIDKILNGEKNVLSQEQLLAFEETSGSTSMSKLIPYTQSLRNEFQKGVAAWICSLFISNPEVFNGPSYWSLSPATRIKRKTNHGIPIGMESDNEYFNPFTRFLLSNIWAVSPSISQETAPEIFYLKTLKELLLKDKLALLSIWSPAFLIQLDNFLQKNLPYLLDWLSVTKEGSSKRRNFLNDKLKNKYTWKSLFPSLRMVSCWTHAQAELSLPGLRARLGEVPIQAKGLLATEGITSIPVHPEYDPVLSLRSHFFEFRPVDQQKIFLAHQLKIGGVYETILTTGGGLYRYASGDLVKVTGFFRSNPSLIFIGRTNRRSDLVGEKMSEHHVLLALNFIPNLMLTRINCLFVCPSNNQGSFQYNLFISFKNNDYAHSDLQKVKEVVESGLEENPYYAQALRLGQLKPLKVRPLKEEESFALKEFLKNRNKIKDGDFKMPALFKVGELEEWMNF
ncbi:MAG: GH3 auxin-responsive promoter family protein [Bacteroidia bacterium]|nr:GH3 auxin-responsive promoter family protein [Bacteroidia bacterium]